VPVETGQPYSELVFPPSAMDLPNVRKDLDPGLDRLLEKHIPSAPPSGFPLLHQVESVLRAQLVHGPATLEQTAQRLSMSPRTLQRRLHTHGLTFSALVQGVRRDLAATYLRNSDLNITEVALLLGFSDISNFTRSFREWYGQPPTAYRRQHWARNNA